MPRQYDKSGDKLVRLPGFEQFMAHLTARIKGESAPASPVEGTGPYVTLSALSAAAARVEALAKTYGWDIKAAANQNSARMTDG